MAARSRTRRAPARSANSRWAAHVLGPALRGLHPDRRIAKAGQVVRARLHVDRTDLAGQPEAVRDEFTGDQRRQLVRPLVEVHVRVQATGLFEVGLRGTRRLQHVERAGGRREEPERVEVAAAHAIGVDDGRGLRRRQAQRPFGVAQLVRGLAVDHRPLVHAEAAEVRRPRRRAGEHLADPRDRVAASRTYPCRVERDPGGPQRVVRAEVGRIGVGEQRRPRRDASGEAGADATSSR